MSYRFEGKDIVIDGWERGIADSPFANTNPTALGNVQTTGIADVRNLNLITIPTEASVQYKMLQASQIAVSGVAYTASAAADTLTYTGTTIKAGTAMVITVSTGTAGITSGNTYWARDVTATTFKVGAGVDGAGNVDTAVNITSDGTGTFTTVNLGLTVQMVNNADVAQTATAPTTITTTSYVIDANGRAWVFIPATPNWVYLGNTTLNADAANGIAVWNAYILVFEGAQIDYRPINGTSSLSAWTYAWKGSLATATKRTFVDKDGILFFCNQHYLGSLKLANPANAFDPTSSTTYIYTATALAIPKFDTAQCLEQLNDQILIGGAFNTVYVWDTFSTGYSAIYIAENNVKRMVTVNTNTYIFAGDRGRIYITNGSNAQMFKKMPDHLSGVLEPFYTWGDAIFNKNQLYFTVSCLDSASKTAVNNYAGIWAIDVDTQALREVNKLSYGTYVGVTGQLQYTSAPSSNGGATYDISSLVVGWYDGSIYGSDYIPSSPTPYSNFEAYVQSDMIPIGNYLNPTTDSQLEYKFSAPLASGEQCRFSYRQNITDSFTLVTSLDRPAGLFTSTDGFAANIQVNFQKSQWIQIMFEISSTASTPSYGRLKELRIRQ